MQRTHRPSPRETTGGDDAFPAPWGMRRPPIAVPVQGRPAEPSSPAPGVVDREVRDAARTEGVSAAQMLGLAPGGLSADHVQDEVEARLRMIRELPDPVVDLARSFACLRPESAAVVASMVARLAAATRRSATRSQERGARAHR